MLSQKNCGSLISFFGCGLTYAAVPHKGTVDRLCLKLPDVSRVEYERYISVWLSSSKIRRIFRVLRNTLFDFSKTTSPVFPFLMRAIIAGVISPVWRQLTALSDGSDKERFASILATWQVTPGTSGSTKLFSLISLSVKIPNDTSATSLSEHADRDNIPETTRASARIFFFTTIPVFEITPEQPTNKSRARRLLEYC